MLLITVVAAIVRHRDALSLWSTWDGRWYLGIAVHGYDWGVRGKPAVAFFPFYPLLIHIVRALGIPAIPAGMLVSNLAFLGALFYVYALARPEWGSRAARHAIVLLAFFPTAYVTFAPYSESLFLLCAAGALFHARRGDVVIAGIWVTLALLTRSMGVALLPAVLLATGGTRPLRWLQLMAPSVVGASIYALYLQRMGIPPSIVLHAQRAWHRSLTFPWTGFTHSLQWLVLRGPSNIPWAAENLLGLAVTSGFLTLTFAARRDLTPAALVYCIVFWATILCSPQWMDNYYAPFSSVDRFVLALFPLAPWVAIRLSDFARRRTQLLLGAGFVLATGFLVGGGWVG